MDFWLVQEEDEFVLNTHCKFVECGWLGDYRTLRCHVEGCHQPAVITAGASGRFDLTVEHLEEEALLLCARGNQYWLLNNLSGAANCVEKGVFAVGDAEITSYMLKLRKRSPPSVEYLGPFQVREESSTIFDVPFSHQYVTDTNITLFLGQSQAASVDTHKKFECCVCWDSILQNARFCGRGHFLCDTCFKEVMKSPNNVCPVCREKFLDVTQSADIENLLSGLKLRDN